jgi:site-specific DNA recombinase
VDRGESAKTTDRPEFQAMIDHGRANKDRIGTVVVYRLDRFARQHEQHVLVRGLLMRAGAMLRSVTEPVDESPNGRLMETTIAGFAQWDNDQRAKRTRDGMAHAMGIGRWPFKAPIGYLNGARGGPSLLPDPLRAPFVAQAFEEIAVGRPMSEVAVGC